MTQTQQDVCEVVRFMKNMKITALGIAALIASGTGLLVKQALADGSIDLTGTVPDITTLDVVWANPSVPLGATSNIDSYPAIAALQVYSNHANGYTISAFSTNTGNLLGATTAVSVPYQVVLYATFAAAVAHTTFLTKIAAGNGGADSALATPGANLAGTVALYTSGTLAVPINTGSGAGAYFLGGKILSADVATLLSDDYEDTINLHIVGN